jgi:hypothetical protein
MNNHLMNKKFKAKEIRFKSSIGLDGIPETIISDKQIQQVLDQTRGNLVVEYV